jgi:hypothetical protein
MLYNLQKPLVKTTDFFRYYKYLTPKKKKKLTKKSLDRGEYYHRMVFFPYSSKNDKKSLLNIKPKKKKN